MISILVSALAIVAASFVGPIDASVNNLAVRDSSSNWSPILSSELNGGLGGDFFAGPSYSDLVAWVQQQGLPKITRFGIRGDKRVDQINYEVAFPNGSVYNYSYGGEGGKPVSLQLNDGEVINEVVVQLGGRILTLPERDHKSRRGVPVFPEPSPNLDSDDELRAARGNVLAETGAFISLRELGILMGLPLLVGFSSLFIPLAGFMGVLKINKKAHNSLRLYYMCITTSSGRTLQQGTMDDQPMTTYTPRSNYTRLVGFVGRAGAEVDAIAPVWG